MYLENMILKVSKPFTIGLPFYTVSFTQIQVLVHISHSVSK